MYRPLSPHIFIYKPQISSIFSVFHRITGCLLALLLTLSIVYLKISILHITYYPIYYIGFLLNSYLAWIVVGILIIAIYSIFYHLSNGIRHLLWDSSKSEQFLQKDVLQKSAYVTIFVTLILGTTTLYAFWLLVA